MYQYRITVGTRSKMSDACPSEQWSETIAVCEERGLDAKLERRLITDADIIETLTDKTGWMIIKGRAISPWEIIAAAEYSSVWMDAQS